MATTYTIRTWTPRWLREVETELDRALAALNDGETAESSAAPAACQWTPSTDLYERSEDVIVELDLPGVDRASLDLTVQDGVLIVKAERKASPAAEKSASRCVERPVGEFYRTIELPEKVLADKVEATYEDGVLKITLPKQPEAQPHRITVRTAAPVIDQPKPEADPS